MMFSDYLIRQINSIFGFARYAASIFDNMGPGFGMVGAGLPAARAVICLAAVPQTGKFKQPVALYAICSSRPGGVHHIAAANGAAGKIGKL
jgi:hypothetical protein